MYWQELFQQTEMQICWRLCNNSEIHLWFRKVWSLVVSSQSSFYVKEHVKTTKKDKTRFFFAKMMNLVHNKQLLLNVPFESSEHRKKKLCVDNKVQVTIGDVYCLTCRNEKCVLISTKKATSFYVSKKCNACCHVLNIPCKDQNRQYCCLAKMVDIVLQERLVATTKKKINLQF